MPTTAPRPARSSTFQAALNGGPLHPAMPTTPEAIAADAAACVAAGVTLLHLHAYTDDGVESLEEVHVARAVEAVRRACPGTPISMTTFAQIEPDPTRRLETISRWSVLPDLVPANQGEEGIEELTDLLLARGVGVEACVFTVADAEAMIRRGRTERFTRVVVEPMEPDPDAARETSLAIEATIARAGVGLEQVHHGMGPATWPMLRHAVSRGHGIRIGLEDVTVLPDGTEADGNEVLARAAADLRRVH